MRQFILRAMLALAGLCACVQVQAETIRIKDLGKVSGWRENALTGYGLVTGLAGTGDSSRNKATRQSIANMLARFDMTVVAEDVQSRNAAAVMVTASLSPFAREGDTLDVTVTSLGDARSLVGGTLILAPLKGPDGKVYALAQGALTVGGYKYDMNGNVQQKNHPTVASIPSGATVERGVVNDVTLQGNSVTFVLSEPDYTTASRVAAAINRGLGGNLATALDPSGIEINIPEARRSRLNDFLMAVENVSVEPDRRARVVINERTGTVVAGGDVRISKVAVSHGELKVSILTDNTVSQPLLVSNTGAGVRTAQVSNSRVDVEERGETGLVTAGGNTVADLVQSLTRVKTNTRDIISILRAVKAAGALHAELIVQ
ncbi:MULTISPECIES: flagellar basal body P-ring protein FlgI [unclassified Duganella]|uniref:flagellar basal body P-ring protein FlgI n=1 Tax=unclassified Duganella TaxID=2636909 RepID=UPI0006F27CC6|nr:MULTISPECIES: flagellar basal body P-ring protein FlgI [unclassified Duganella]KQV57987.1 flagellar biosynthesis protein FlgI [Duganella sp. Root336D2]KRB99162.1 flagellar biosynthesis protein FlgI [Duganella sp. Root198D2]